MQTNFPRTIFYSADNGLESFNLILHFLLLQKYYTALNKIINFDFFIVVSRKGQIGEQPTVSKQSANSLFLDLFLAYSS